MSDAPQTGLALAGKPESRQAVMPPRVDTQVGLWMVCLRMVAVWWTFFKVTTIVFLHLLVVLAATTTFLLVQVRSILKTQKQRI